MLYMFVLMMYKVLVTHTYICQLNNQFHMKLDFLISVLISEND